MDLLTMIEVAANLVIHVHKDGIIRVRHKKVAVSA